MDQPTRKEAFEAFLKHRENCSACREAIENPPVFPGVLVHLLPLLFVCDEGLDLAKICVAVSFDPDMLVAIPFSLPGSAGIDRCLIPIRPGDEIDVRTESIPWASFSVAGFRARIYHQDTDPFLAEGRRLLGVEEMVLVTDLKIGGSINLFWHEGFVDLRTYEKGKLSHLRANPPLLAPNQAFVSLYRPRVSAEEDRPLYVTCDLLVDPVRDELGGTGGRLGRSYRVHNIKKRIRAATDALFDGIETATAELAAIVEPEPYSDNEEGG